MRLIHRRHPQRGKTPRIAISQAEITADLHYPGSRGDARQLRTVEAPRGGGR